MINDGSIDGTHEVASDYGGRIIYERQQNHGETATRNRGFELSRGQYVTFLDHDDYWESGELLRNASGF